MRHLGCVRRNPSKGASGPRDQLEDAKKKKPGKSETYRAVFPGQAAFEERPRHPEKQQQGNAAIDTKLFAGMNASQRPGRND